MNTPRILLIDKPKGITSFDCIRILRKKLHANSASTPAGSGNAKAPTRIKMGHAGTLDPMATGLMIIGVGDGTKKLHEFLKLDKTYEAEILLGVKTDTGDVTGKVLEELGSRNYELSEEKIKKVLRSMVGTLDLPVPAYSAIKRGGEALYKKARRGEVVDAPIKEMEIKSAEFLGLYDPTSLLCHSRESGNPALCSRLRGDDKLIVKARFSVASGTYIRSLAEELGHRLGVPATLAGLRRTRIGEFKVEDAQKIDPQP